MVPRAIEITNLPPPEPNVSNAQVLFMDGRLALIYACQGRDWPGSHQWAAVMFQSCRAYKGGGPNDEARHNHPLQQLGIGLSGTLEIANSPWIAQWARTSDSRGDPARLSTGARHFVFALKESTFECIALGYLVLGEFESLADAWQAVFSHMGPTKGYVI